MKRWAARVQRVDDRWICHVTRQWRCGAMDWLMPRITHVGGAGFTLSFLLFWWVFVAPPLKNWAVEGLISLAGSHGAVVLCKHYLHRMRPYLTLVPLHHASRPLKDCSFPSGHTTAAFSLAVIWVLHVPVLAVWLLPLAAGVGFSRVYLGLHYPSDVVAGAWLGSVFAACTHAFFH